MDVTKWPLKNVNLYLKLRVTQKSPDRRSNMFNMRNESTMTPPCKQNMPKGSKYYIPRSGKRRYIKSIFIARKLPEVFIYSIQTLISPFFLQNKIFQVQTSHMQHKFLSLLSFYKIIYSRYKLRICNTNFDLSFLFTK